MKYKSRLRYTLETYLSIVVLAAAILGCVALMGGCGTAARDNALMPAIRLSWTGVRDDVSRGVMDAYEDGDIDATQGSALNSSINTFEQAMDSRTTFATKAPIWPTLRPYGDRGIQDRVDDGEIGTGVAESLTERLDNFTEAVSTVVE